MSVKVCLLPWEPRVSAGYGYIEVSIEDGEVEFHRYIDARIDHPDGWFAVFDDSVFGVFEWRDSNEYRVALLISGKIWRLTPDVELACVRALTHRSFRLKCRSGIVVYDYQKLWWNLFHRPLYAVSEVLLADDWWGVVCDLPGWVTARWNAGKLLDELASGLKKPHKQDAPTQSDSE